MNWCFYAKKLYLEIIAVQSLILMKKIKFAYFQYPLITSFMVKYLIIFEIAYENRTKL